MVNGQEQVNSELEFYSHEIDLTAIFISLPLKVGIIFTVCQLIKILL
jgi:hypothetical protein